MTYSRQSYAEKSMVAAKADCKIWFEFEDGAPNEKQLCQLNACVKASMTGKMPDVAVFSHFYLHTGCVVLMLT